MKDTQTILIEAKAAVAELNGLTSEKKNAALHAMADALLAATGDIVAANDKDMQAAKGKMGEVMLDRLMLDAGRIRAMADGMRELTMLPDPVGETLATVERGNGLVINKVSVPLGVIAIIYESRPNVTSDAAALALKAGNVCILRSGKEAFGTAYAIVKALHQGLKSVGLPETAVNLVEDTTRESANALMRARGYVDLLIPRGGAGLIRACVENAIVPCIHTGTGICHIYVDKDADLEMALKIIDNAKMSRPSVCNSQEVCLVHEAIAAEFLPRLKAQLTDPAREHVAELRLDERAIEIISGTPASETDFDTEFLNYILAVKVVASADEAIAHIAEHSTHHSDAIISENTVTSAKFARMVDSAAVYINASTRFTDGGEFGLGCEMGISTQKMHARGPMGLKELTTYKYLISGTGQIR